MMNKIDYEIEHSPAYASLIINLQADQTVLIESGAMAAMDSSISMKSKVRGGLMTGLGRMVSGESFFVSEFTAEKEPGQIYVSPGVPGDIQHYYLRNQGLMVQSSGFVACSPEIEIDTQFQGFKGFFSGESLFLIRATGQGDFWFSSYGAIVEIPVAGDYVVDTGYIVAFEDTLNYQVEVLGGLSFRGLKTGVLGGEGLVCRFSGEGRLWIQSRELYGLINFLNPFRPTKSD
ncbi:MULTISPECIES: TIGR00266 family protein [unclassified Moorena]|uniref:TIGR00266 family protein n=1 Tax=unclassified Moorena TaxID=2683338 RepID=UPI0013C1ECB7|nr:MULTISPECIES: TIGR00266 family protein [unclassified Moorena]NEP33761.1 TIGR00266 family protein [Moorena sp. SIO3B2]NES42576.1 TIGR00266 family protein [Moorena sp. SIO2C4]NET65257.1 TIGR00266 family protein [Moorena sp. SIO1G6]